MPGFPIEFHRGGIHLPQLGLWLDAHEPRTGPERVFVSHAHSDHTEAHRETIVSAPTARLMQARIGSGVAQTGMPAPPTRLEHILPFREPKPFSFENASFRITLLPAGHVFGSAMSLIEAEGHSLLYTGDFKLRRGLSAEPCEPQRADLLIMETTYGRPQYAFPPADAVMKSVVRFCREALDNEETPVLLGYSLGKSQELLCGIADAGLPLMLHGAVYRLTQVYEQFGQCFPKYERYDSGSARGKVLLCPPHVINSAMLRNVGRTRTAILTGWAVDPNCRYRYQCDAAFPLSDHADYSELIELVKQVQPKKVLTLHGFAADFARDLRELGFDAQALSEEEQLALALNERRPDRGPRRLQRSPSNKNASVDSESPLVSSAAPEDGRGPDAPHAFARFAETCSRIAATPSKLEKIGMVAGYLSGLSGPAAAITATWFSGRPLPVSQNKVLQLGWAVLRDAFCAVAEVDETILHQVYLKHSDLGETAYEILQGRGVQPMLSVEEVEKLFHKLHAARGPVAKRPLLARALAGSSPLEAKYLVKIITGDLRIGLKEGLVEEAVARAYARTADEVRQANLLLGDIGQTAKLVSEGKLHEATLDPFRPVKFMLASPEPTAEAIWERVCGAGVLPAAPGSGFAPGRPEETGGKDVARGQDLCATTVWIEDKYDGIRCQLHKVGRRVALYSRDLKEITATFLELADSARALPDDFILDGEILAMRGEEVLPFADLQKRLGRREVDLFLRDEVPVKLVAFDLLWLNGESCINLALAERRRKLESMAWPGCFALARISPAGSPAEIENAFGAARQRGNEGLMVKDPKSVYAPGRRGLAWLKLKKALATLDCVVVGAEYGHGKRNKVLSDYTFAVRDEQTGELKTIGKAYSGLTDAEIAQLTEHFLSKTVRKHGRYHEVEPDTVLEIAFDRLQPSDRHNSGLAMRFPRIARLRTDKSVADIDTLATARKLVK